MERLSEVEEQSLELMGLSSEVSLLVPAFHVCQECNWVVALLRAAVPLVFREGMWL